LCPIAPVFVKKSDFELAGNAPFSEKTKHGIGDAKHIFTRFQDPSQTVLKGFSETEQRPSRGADWSIFCKKKREVRERTGGTPKNGRGEEVKKYFFEKVECKV
jgi:hypothetical protein